jgi:hypothetical protein
LQLPSAQAAEPWLVPEHILAQAPQLAGSLAQLTQAPAQLCVPLGQSSWHTPPLHTSPAAQA